MKREFGSWRWHGRSCPCSKTRPMLAIAVAGTNSRYCKKVERRLVRLGVPTKEVDRWADKCWRLYANVLINADKEAR